jgi:hypothetical protein
MKHKTHSLYYLFNTGAHLLIVVLLFSTIVKPQQTNPPEKFYIGAKLGNTPYEVEETFKSYLECGFNSIWWGAYPDTKLYLDEFPGILMAENGRSRKDFIHHYATSYYSKWEAEQNQKPNRVGIKHQHGKETEWKGVKCWSSIGLKSPKISLIYGPHYRQEKRYKRWLYNDPGWSRFDVDYNVRFKMAVSYDSRMVSEDEDVCEIKVVYRCVRQYPGGWDPHEDFILLRKTLKIKDFPKGGAFDYISFNKTYEYSEKFMIPEFDNPAKSNYTYNDTEAGLGIQFQVDWLRKNDLCTLYVDHIEVYDNDGWNDMIKDPKGTAEKIKNYTKKFSDWSSIKYWFVHDEPYSLDAFMPYHIVDSIVTTTTGIPLITEFNPYWTHDDKINGEDFLQLWYDIAKPQKLFIDHYPFSPEYPFRLDDIEALRVRFQKCHTLQPGFWYSPQAAGVLINNEWKIWRIPESYEFNASVMLGLAHGAKGLMLFSYDSFSEIKGLVANNQPNFEKRKLWYFLRDKLIPRLKGELGDKLIELEYTGNYLQYYKIGKMQSNPTIHRTQDDFLTLGLSQTKSEEKNWHCGLFTRPEHPDDKYFFLTNLYTTANSRSIDIRISEKKQKYENFRFRNIEGVFDTTFQNQFTTDLIHIHGEGYLYQVAPVVKYGGKLLYSEETMDGMELTEEMIIENGAVLTINGNYHSKANIIIKNGRVEYKNKGKIHFAENKKLITK